MSIFISHSHSDAALAAHFEDYLKTITSHRIEIHRSSRQGSIEYGDNWIDWINDKVENATITFILLTPSSFDAKWVLWEAGAVSGVKRAVAAKNEDERRVIPVRFLIPHSEDLGPFGKDQIADGLDINAMVALGRDVLSKLRDKEDGVPGSYVDDALLKLSDTSRAFIENAQQALRSLQIFQREDLVQEWLSRLDKELGDQNAQYVNSAYRWINVAFLGEGKAGETKVPIDFRIHVRLSTGFRLLKDWENAKVQLKLANRLSPRDMMVLRELGRTELELKHPKEALTYFHQMLRLDENVFDGDPDALNLYVRILITDNDWPGALEQLQKAGSLSEKDSYVANMLAISAMKVEGAKSARKYFLNLRNLEKKRGGKSIWSLGNLVNAALGLADEDDAIALLTELKDSPDASQYKDSITRYFSDIVEAQEDFDFDWKQYWP